MATEGAINPSSFPSQNDPKEKLFECGTDSNNSTEEHARREEYDPCVTATKNTSDLPPTTKSSEDTPREVDPMQSNNFPMESPDEENLCQENDRSEHSGAEENGQGSGSCNSGLNQSSEGNVESENNPIEKEQSVNHAIPGVEVNPRELSLQPQDDIAEQSRVISGGESETHNNERQDMPTSEETEVKEAVHEFQQVRVHSPGEETSVTEDTNDDHESSASDETEYNDEQRSEDGGNATGFHDNEPCERTNNRGPEDGQQQPNQNSGRPDQVAPAQDRQWPQPDRNQAHQIQRSTSWDDVCVGIIGRFSNQTEFEKFARSSLGLSLREEVISEIIDDSSRSSTEKQRMMLERWKKDNDVHPDGASPERLDRIKKYFFSINKPPQRLEDAFQDIIIPAFTNRAHFNNFARSSNGLELESDTLDQIHHDCTRNVFRYQMEVLKHWRMEKGEGATAAVIIELKNSWKRSQL